jgi:hypothetical protein
MDSDDSGTMLLGMEGVDILYGLGDSGTMSLGREGVDMLFV